MLFSIVRCDTEIVVSTKRELVWAASRMHVREIEFKNGINKVRLFLNRQKNLMCMPIKPIRLIKNPLCSIHKFVHAVACALYVYNTISMVATWHISYKIYTCREAYGETSLVAKNRWKIFTKFEFRAKNCSHLISRPSRLTFKTIVVEMSCKKISTMMTSMPSVVTSSIGIS